MQILSSTIIEVLGNIFILRYSAHIRSIVHGEFVSAGRSLAVIDLSQDALTLVDDGRRWKYGRSLSSRCSWTFGMIRNSFLGVFTSEEVVRTC